MKKVIILFSILIFGNQTFAEKVSKERARKVAENWATYKLNKSKGIENDVKMGFSADSSLFVFNFIDNGFVIIPDDDNTNPILAYSYHSNFNPDNLPLQIKDWLAYYDDMINENKNTKYSDRQKIKAKWKDIEEGNIMKSSSSVPSLFESSQSSRWSYWKPYVNQAPDAGTNSEGHNCCVPIAMSQIMKYHAYPPIGTGSHSYSYDGISISENFNEFFDYDKMPFRLTYCGNNEHNYDNCYDNNFNTIPGITQEQKDEIGKLQYLAGVSVETLFLGNRNPSSSTSGTYGTTNIWATKLVSNFYYSSNFDYWNSNEINNNPSSFKSSLRSSISNNLPALFRYAKSDTSAHCIVIDGYEDDDFFHFIEGMGGYLDGYYYLFSNDDDGVHTPRPFITEGGLNCAMDIEPDCPDYIDISRSNISINSGEGQLIQSGKGLTISNIVVNSGGRVFIRALEEITIPYDFEVKSGAEVIITCEPCNN